MFRPGKWCNDYGVKLFINVFFFNQTIYVNHSAIDISAKILLEYLINNK